METHEARDEPLRNAVAETVVRLRGAGIERVNEDEDPDELATLLEAVERFEDRVRARGGDLMVDEPPPGRLAQPDNPRFVLPVRSADESLPQYTMRVLAAADSLGRNG